MLSFAHAWGLALLPLPWLLWLAARWWHTRRPPLNVPALIHPQAALLAQLATPRAASWPWGWLLACSLLIVALARPQWWPPEAVAEQRARNILLTIDASASMRAQDFALEGRPLSRLDMVKTTAAKLMQEYDQDRYGLVVFGDAAYTLSPLSRDVTLINTLLRDIESGIAGNQTALGDAMALAVERLRQQATGARIMIVLTDGTQTAGELQPSQAALLAQQYGVRIYTIGIGTHNKVLFPLGGIAQPQYSELPFDEALLKAVAAQTGGRYFQVMNTEAMQQTLQDINTIERVPSKDSYRGPHDEWYGLPLALALLMLLSWQRLRRSEVWP